MKYANFAGRALTTVMAMTIVLCAQLSHADDSGMADRIKAVGSVCVEGESCAANLTVAAAGPKSGEDVYKTCAACHSSGAAGAPKFRDADDWADRLSAGLDAVYANAINGIGGMPAKGLCMSCSDDEIKAAVDHMIEGL
jgi:predicted CxxxxCH...CXXCH cytochrome family protein